MRLISEVFTDSTQVARAIELLNLESPCGSPAAPTIDPNSLSESDRVRCRFLKLAFPEIQSQWRLCLSFDSRHQLTIRTESFMERLAGYQANLARVVDLFANSGGDSCHIARQAEALLAYEQGTTTFLCLVRNLYVHMEERQIPEDTSVTVCQNVPDIFLDETIREQIKEFKPTLFIASVPWSNYLKTRQVRVRFGTHQYTPYEMAKEFLKYAPILFKLPLPKFFTPHFRVEPDIVCKVPDVPAYAIYYLKSVDDLEELPSAHQRRFEFAPNMYAISSLVKTIADIDDAIQVRKLTPRPEYEQYNARMAALHFAFSEIQTNINRLAIDYESIRKVPHRRDEFLELLKGVDMSRTFEMFAGCGGYTTLLAKEGFAVRCYEKDEDRYLCLLRNLTVYHQEGVIRYRGSSVEAVQDLPDLSGGDLEEFGATAILASIPWGDYDQTGRIEVELGGKRHSPQDLALLALKRSRPVPVVFCLPGMDRYDPNFGVPPINVYRNSKYRGEYLAYSVYVVRTLADLAGPEAKGKQTQTSIE